MTARGIIAAVEAEGCRLRVEGGELRLQRPAGRDLPADLREALRAQRQEIISALTAPPAPSGTPCQLCGRQKAEIAGRPARCPICDGPFGPLAPEEAT